MKHDFPKRFKGKILKVTGKTAEIWGKIQADAEKQGRKMPAIDSLLAATAIFYGMVLVTRNISDIEICKVSVFNPWNIEKTDP